MRGSRPLPAVLLTSNDVEFVFHVRTAAGPGSAFLHQDELGFYFVSAGHLFMGVKPGENIQFHRADDNWLEFEVIEIIFHPNAADVCCFTLALDIDFKGNKPYKLEPKSFIGDEVKFVGFPHGLEGNYPSGHGFSTGLVRTAFFSGMVNIEGNRVTIFDGFNNPGFSGAPVYCNSDNGTAVVCAVVTGFRNERASLGQLFKREGDGVVEVEGHFIQRLNSGLIYAADVGQIHETARALGSRQRRRPDSHIEF